MTNQIGFHVFAVVELRTNGSQKGTLNISRLSYDLQKETRIQIGKMLGNRYKKK